MTQKTGWKRKKRKAAYASRYVTVYEDEVLLPNGTVIADYTVLDRPSVVVVVTMNDKEQIIFLHEYKYAAGRFMWGLVAGHMEVGELPVDAAKRELEEETGFVAESYEVIGTLKEYATKDLHDVYVVKATGLHQTGKKNMEDTELIDSLEFFSKDQIVAEMNSGNIPAATVIAALVLVGFFH